MKASLHRPGSAFTLVELVVAMSVLFVLMVILVQLTNGTSRIWSQTTGNIEQFKEARDAFESMTRRLSQATLNTYWDYHYPNNDKTKPADAYQRQSELRFITGDAQALAGLKYPAGHAVFFQAPLGFTATTTYVHMQNLLNTWGFFIDFGSDQDMRPGFLGPKIPLRYRFRLYELMEPSESLSLYKYSSGNPSYAGKEWFTDPLKLTPATSRPTRALAENIIALILLPKLSPQEDVTETRLAPQYSYDSTAANSDPTINPKNQLPPVIQLTVVAVDEATFGRIQAGAVPPDFGLTGLFAKAENYHQDLATLEATLQRQKLNYRVFSTNVSIRGAKWSREQKN